MGASYWDLAATLELASCRFPGPRGCSNGSPRLTCPLPSEKRNSYTGDLASRIVPVGRTRSLQRNLVDLDTRSCGPFVDTFLGIPGNASVVLESSSSRNDSVLAHLSSLHCCGRPICIESGDGMQLLEHPAGSLTIRVFDVQRKQAACPFRTLTKDGVVPVPPTARDY